VKETYQNYKDTHTRRTRN